MLSEYRRPWLLVERWRIPTKYVHGAASRSASLNCAGYGGTLSRPAPPHRGVSIYETDRNGATPFRLRLFRATARLPEPRSRKRVDSTMMKTPCQRLVYRSTTEDLTIYHVYFCLK